MNAIIFLLSDGYLAFHSLSKTVDLDLSSTLGSLWPSSTLGGSRLSSGERSVARCDNLKTVASAAPAARWAPLAG